MKRLIHCYFLLFGLDSFAQGYSISGTVKDSGTGEPLSFCSVGILGSTFGLTADSKGNFKINIPGDIKSPQLIVSYLGFISDTVTISKTKAEYLIVLKPTQAMLNEVVVTGVSKATLIRENPVPVISVSLKDIDQSAESNLIEALVKNVPGLNAVKTGPNISKPFIRGLGYNRVLTLYDGIRQEGQQWGDEHGLEVDAYNMQRAEVIKGPASLMYGSDALAGVVSLVPYVPDEKDSVIRGRLLSEYQSNNGLSGNGLRLGYSGSHWLWTLRGNYRIAKNYTNSIDGRIYNTAFREKNASALIGYVNDKISSHLNFTLYDNLQGIPDGSRDSLRRQFTKQVAEASADNIKNRPVVPAAELNAYQLSPLLQHIQHYRAYTSNHYKLRQGDIDAIAGFQQNTRREYNHPTDPGQAGMYVRLNTINYSLSYNAPRIFKIETSFGVNGMYQANKNKAATDFPIPDYRLLDIGSYLYAKWKHRQWTISGGLRYDTRMLYGNNFYVARNPVNGFMQQAHTDTPVASLQFAAFKKTFTGVSSSIGSTYWLSEKISIKANIARGYRAPNITEFAANGLDPGAHIVYLGNRNFVPEFSLQEDLGISASFKNASASVSIFNNNIRHYIYLSQLVDAAGNPILISQGNKTFQYQQASAQLYGIEASVDLHPAILKGFNLAGSFSQIYGFNTKTQYQGKGINGAYLPFIPPLKLLGTASQDLKTKWKTIPAINIKIEADYNAAQNRYLALYNTEMPTAGYTLLNTAVGVEILYSKKQIIRLQLQVNNVLDKAYQSNLSRLKYFEYYQQQPGNHYGMYGMGRNICIKAIVPF